MNILHEAHCLECGECVIIKLNDSQDCPVLMNIKHGDSPGCIGPCLICLEE